jgi:hypothetical protein
MTKDNWITLKAIAIVGAIGATFLATLFGSSELRICFWLLVCLSYIFRKLKPFFQTLEAINKDLEVCNTTLKEANGRLEKSNKDFADEWEGKHVKRDGS